MSKRSTTEAQSAPPRRPFGLPRLADVRIRFKLGLILVVPLVALAGIAGIRLYDSAQQALEAEDSATLAEFASEATKLAYALQSERIEVAIRINKDRIDLEDGRDSMSRFEAAVAETDRALDDFQSARAELPEQSDGFNAVLDNIDDLLGDDMEGVRRRVDEDRAAGGDMGVYSAGINWLNSLFDDVLRTTTDPGVSNDLQAVATIMVADEHSERMRMLMLGLADGSSFGNQRFSQFVHEAASRDQTLTDYNRIATSDLSIPRIDTLSGLGSIDTFPAREFEQLVLTSAASGKLSVNHVELMAAYDVRHQASNGYITQLQDKSVTDASGVRDAVVRQVLIEIAAVLITLVLAILAALLIARSMAQSLSRLREGALEVAHVSLPRAVAQMRDTDNIGQRTPDQVVEELDDPLSLDNQDEIGTVAGAFNTVHREAVRIAAEQAALRSSVSQMFVNLARRSQNLVDRLIGHLDRLERGEEDPDRLAELFQLDHLATRMRRNDENLLVLAGADSTRVERSSAQIGDVLRAAQSEVEQYTRIEFGTVLADAEVEAGAINDIVHLVAELLDNATAFSPPDTSVIAEARQVGEEILVRITDRGIGISPDQLAALNTQLATPTSVDIAASRMMGLVVVARLAHRHNLRVNLQEGSGRGTVAEVVLPAEVLTGPSEDATRSIDAGDAADSDSNPSFYQSQPLAPMPRNESIDSPQNLFEPQDATASFAAQASDGDLPARGTDSRSGGRGVAFHPGDGVDESLPRRKIMEVTGEIVAESADPASEVALPMIRLDAAPLPGKAPEIPEPRDGSKPPAWPAVAAGGRTADPVAAAGKFGAMDETMELPIFREVESSWFKTSTPPPRPAEADEADPPAEPAGFEATGERDGGLSRRRIDTAPEAPEVPEFDPTAGGPQSAASSWHTAADRGWQVAAEIDSRQPDESTGAGLPKRRPMERLVPGSVDQPEQNRPSPTVRRDPEGVRGLLSAYHRGVQRGRGNDS